MARNKLGSLAILAGAAAVSGSSLYLCFTGPSRHLAMTITLVLVNAAVLALASAIAYVVAKHDDKGE